MDIRHRFDFGAGVGRATGVADRREEFYIVDVIADEADLIESNAQLGAYLLSRSEFCQTIRVDFGADAEVEVLKFEFLCAGLDDRRVLGSEDAARDTCLLETDHAHAVIDTETLEYLAFGGVIHAAVREAAIDVCQKEFNRMHSNLVL